MKRNRLHLFLVLALLLALFLSACGESEIPYDTSPDYSSEYGDGALYENPEQNQTQEQEAPALSENEPEQYGLEFDFYGAVQNIYLFGNKISLPCTFEDFGKKFSLSESVVIADTERNVLLITFCYKKDIIGFVTLKDCNADDKNKESKTVYSIVLGDSYRQISTREGWYKKLIELDFLGVNFNSSSEDVKSILGTPEPLIGAYYDSRLVYSKTENAYIDIKFIDDVMVEFKVNVRGIS